jgi:hypothetical protein
MTTRPSKIETEALLRAYGGLRRNLSSIALTLVAATLARAQRNAHATIAAGDSADS